MVSVSMGDQYRLDVRGFPSHLAQRPLELGTLAQVPGIDQRHSIRTVIDHPVDMLRPHETHPGCDSLYAHILLLFMIMTSRSGSPRVLLVRYARNMSDSATVRGIDPTGCPGRGVAVRGVNRGEARFEVLQQ